MVENSGAQNISPNGENSGADQFPLLLLNKIEIGSSVGRLLSLLFTRSSKFLVSVTCAFRDASFCELLVFRNGRRWQLRATAKSPRF